MRVLAFGAHPDDAEIFCGGTLARYREQGAEVTIAIATRGDIGAPEGDREAIANMRHNEALDAARVIDAEVLWLGYDDEFLFSNRETRMSFIDAIRQAAPDVMLIPSEHDYHPDHRATGTIARDARIPASVPLIVSEHPCIKTIPTTFIVDTHLTSTFAPEAYVDITSVMDTKRKMIDRHESQRLWHEALYPGEFGDAALAAAKYRGAEAACEYAEAFRLLRDYPHTGGFELLPGVTPRDL